MNTHNNRFCVKCKACTNEDQTLKLYRFPKPGRDNTHRMKMWARFCYPEQNWDSEEFQKKLYSSHKMLCSKHFSENSFVLDSQNMKKLHRYAIPSESMSSSSENMECAAEFEISTGQPLEEMVNNEDVSQTEQMNVCRICLDTGSKMYSFSKYDLKETFEKVTGLSLQNDANLLQTLCVQCAQKLINCSRFQDRCLRAHTVLQEITKNPENLKVENIKRLNREIYKLTSNLGTKIFEPNHCDYHFEECKEDNKNSELETVVPCLDSNKVNVKDEKSNDTVLCVKPDEETVSYNDDTVTIKYCNEEYLDFDFIDDIDNKVEVFDNTTIINDESSKGNSDEFNEALNVEFINFVKSDIEMLNDHVKKENNNRILNKNSLSKLKNVKTNEYPPIKLIKRSIRTHPKIKSDNDLKFFVANVLTYEEQLDEVKKRQESTNYTRSKYKCTMCFKGFISKSSHSRHMVKHTDKFGEVACAICSLYFANRLKLINHLNQCHAKTYRCKSCDYVTKQKRAAELHERWHSGTTYKCPKCDEEFKTVSTYMSHLRIKHPSDFICTLCGYSFVSKKGIAHHIRARHRFENVENPQGPECVPCNVRFASEEAFNQHMKVSPKHSSDGSRVRNDPTVYREINLPGSKEYITCEQCGIQVKDFRTYSWHFKKEHSDKNRTIFASNETLNLCDQCGRVFTNQALLDYHMAVHAGQKLLQCNLCEKRFNHKAQLASHMKVHSDNRPTYECPICKKNFMSSSNRDRHVYIHSEKSFHCEICNKAFATLYERRGHIAHVHLKKPWPKRNRGARTKTDDIKLKEESSVIQERNTSAID